MGAAARTRSPSARHAAATPTAPRGPQRAEAPGRIPASRPARCSSGTSGPLRSVTSTRTRPFPTLTATVTVPPAAPTGYAGHYCRTARSPAGRRHPRTGARDRAPRRRTRGRPAPAPPARPLSRSPGSPAQPSAHPPSPAAPACQREITGAARPDVRECTLDSAAHVKPEHATGAARPWPSVESRRCTPTVLAAGRRPLYVRGRRDTGTYSATR